ncbi:hypothetical protein AUG19_03125 [archaeon 13_1_20CM_2_54_9]|nr:MAG: hypothetical protein AUG19_03125 [archaeon 13_1_20CM_2_54_9]
MDSIMVSFRIPLPLHRQTLKISSRDHQIAARWWQARKTAGVGTVTPLEPKVKVAPQSVFYALRTCNGTCASGCGASQTRVAEVVFGIEIVEWDLCSACLSRTGFLEYFSSLPSATPREAEEIRILLGISNETLEGRTELLCP